MKIYNEFMQVFKLSEKLKNRSQMCTIYAISALLLAATSSFMTVMNLRREFYVMGAITGILTVVLLLCAYLSGVRKMEVLPSVIAAICILFMFSYFAVSGQNEGFAILWILLVPLFATGILDMRIGIGLSVYFLFFSVILFYTPLKEHVTDFYSTSFMERFPVLYLCTFMISMFLFLQKEFYSRKLHLKSNMDDLTGAYNRSYFTHFILHAPLPDKGNTCIMLIDINGLKKVNDTLGHEAGDELICAVSHSCHEAIRSDFTLCRIGGDEFVLMIQLPEGEEAKLAQEIKAAGVKWQGEYSQGCQLAIGWASSYMYPEYTVDELFKIADAMMYQDKIDFYRQPGNERRRRREDSKKGE